MIDLKQLEELAKAAKAKPGETVWYEIGQFSGCAINNDDAKFIVSSGPEVILELIETQRMLVEALKSSLAVIDDYLEYDHDGDSWKEDARVMGEMDINDYERDGRRELAIEALKRATGE